MQTINHLFQRELVRLIEEEVERLKDMLSMGNVGAFDEYRLVVGKIAGLRTALDYMAEANSNVERD